MIQSVRRRLLPAAVLAAILGATLAVASAENIDPDGVNEQFAWGENIGWINAEPSGPGGPGVEVSHDRLTGYMYGENIGWINMNCTNNSTCAATGGYGVTNDGTGKLGGYAWGENVGWISFCDQDVPGVCNSGGASTYRVMIDPATGVFSGFAWGENIGWISFADTAPVAYLVRTDDGDGVDGAADNCPFDGNDPQTNTDFAPLITAGPPSLPNDITIPNSDALGDACDPDDDNDGVLDTAEAAGCNGSGALSATDADTDGDRNRDGAECLLGTNPASAASKPLQIPAGDIDTDGIPDALEAGIGSTPGDIDSDDNGVRDGIEYRGYSLSPINANSDGDACNDGREIASINVDTNVNSGDFGAVASVFNRTDRPVQDVDKNGVVNSLDLSLMAGQFTLGAC